LQEKLNKMKKLFLSIFVMALTFNVVATNVWDGSSESWTQGDGTYYNPYRIETAAQLAYLAEKVNEGYQSTGQGVFEGERFLLMDDLDLNNLNWTPIGNVDYDMNGFYFAGFFDGAYHQVENLQIQTNADVSGLFAAVGGEVGCVCNLSVSGTVNSTGIGASGVVGGIAGHAVVSRCCFSGSVSVTNIGNFCGAAGVVAGVQNGRVIECSSSASITVTNTNFMGAAVAGGVVCFAREDAFIQHCYNTGTVTASAMLMGISAGILGATVESANVNIYSSYNVGSISGSTSGGVFGMVSPIDPTKAENEIQVSNCYFLTSASGNNGYGTGMAAEEMQTEEFKNQLDQSAHAFVMDNGTNNGYPIHGLASFVLFEASDITPHTAMLSAWIHEGNDYFARAYFKYHKLDDTDWIEVDVTTDGYVEAVLEELEEDTYYEYTMVCEFGDSIWLECGPFKIFQTGYDAVNEKVLSVMVYPNPASETLYIQCLESTEVQVFNALGQKVKTFKNVNEINVSDWVEGMYLLRIIDADGKVFERKVSVK
jgi:hypothetical protein